MTLAFLSAEVIAPAGSASSAATPFGHAYNGAVLAVDVNVGAGAELVTLTFWGREPGGSWRTLNVVDLNTQLGDLVTQVAYTADYSSQNAVVIPTPVEEIQVTAENTGANAATVTVNGFLR